MATTRELIADVARRMNLLDARGELLPLDSLTVADFLLELETTLHVRVPSVAVRGEHLRSLDELHDWLRTVA